MPRNIRTGDSILYDPEIEKTAKRLRKLSKQRKKQGEASGLPTPVESDTETEYEQEIEFEQQPDGKLNRDHAQDMALNRTLQDLGRPTEAQHPLCIDFPELQEGFELKSGLIHLLPTFRGLENEDPNKHLKEFHLVCTSMKPRNVTEDQIKLRAFPFSLQDAAKDWLYYLPPGTINTWEGMSRQFLEKYFPASRAANIRREICGIKQKDSENLYEYWERYKRILASCPQHGISEQLIIQYFYEGLIPMERRMMDAASGGAIVSKTPAEARELISTMAANSQQFGARPDIPRRVNEVNVTSLNEVKSLLTTLVQKLNVGTPPPARACGICTSPAHPTDACPTLHDETPENVNAIGFQERKFDPYSNTYNPGWRSHPNFSYANNQPTQQNFHHGPPPPQQPSGSGKPLEEIVRMLATNTEKFQQDTATRFHKIEESMKTLETQMSQIASSVSKMETQGKLPSQTLDPRHNVSAIVLRNGKELQPPVDKNPKRDHAQGSRAETEQEAERELTRDHIQDSGPAENPQKPKPLVVPPPFPQRLAQSKKEKEDKSIMELFQKVEVNIPLLEAIKQVPRYAKFLKELCTNKRKLTGNERVSVGENVSAVLQRKLPPKCRDQGMFSIPCKIGNIGISKAMCDLGASINVMPLSVYTSLGLGPLTSTGVIIQLADRSIVYPEGVLEDVLVQVNGLIFPADFFVLDMENDSSSKSSDILLGRPFLSTAKAKIDVHNGSLTLEFDGEVVKFNVYDAMKHAEDVSCVYNVDIIEGLTHEVFALNYDDELNYALCHSMSVDRVRRFADRFEFSDDILDVVYALEALKTTSMKFVPIKLSRSESTLLPSILQAPKLELKKLPEHLKYAYLGDGETLPVIISSMLDGLDKEKTKAFHDHMISRKNFLIGQKFLLYHSRLKLFPEKLRSKWIGPFVITNIFPNGAIEIQNLDTHKVFKVNGHYHKPFYEGFQTQGVEELTLAKVHQGN